MSESSAARPCRTGCGCVLIPVLAGLFFLYLNYRAVEDPTPHYSNSREAVTRLIQDMVNQRSSNLLANEPAELQQALDAAGMTSMEKCHLDFLYPRSDGAQAPTAAGWEVAITHMESPRRSLRVRLEYLPEPGRFRATLVNPGK